LSGAFQGPDWKKTGQKEWVSEYRRQMVQRKDIQEGILKTNGVRRQILSKDFFHPCNSNDTCSVTITLISNPNTFFENEII